MVSYHKKSFIILKDYLLNLPYDSEVKKATSYPPQASTLAAPPAIYDHSALVANPSFIIKILSLAIPNPP
jgi:hypothetical protein